MKKFHKILYEAVLGLGVICLLYECSMLSFRFFDNAGIGFWIALFVIGYALMYKKEEK